MAIAQHVAGYSLGAGRPAAPGDGQEEEVRAGRAVRELLRRHGRPRLLRRRDQDAVGHPAAVLRLRVQQGALRGLRPGVLLDRLPQGELPGRVHGRAAHLGRRRQGQDGHLPGRMPAAWGSRCCRRTSTPRCANFAPVGTDIRFGLSAVRNVGTGVVASIVASRKDKGDYTDFYDFLEKVDAGRLQQEGRRVADQGRRLRLAGASAQGPADGARRAIDEVLGLKKAEAIGQFDLFGEMTPGGEGRRLPRQRPGHRVGHQAAAGVRAGDAGPVRVRASAGRGRAHAVGPVGRLHPGHPGRHRPGPRRGRPSAAS